MAKKGGKGGGDAAPLEGGGSKKAQGQARKAEAANKKAAAENAKLAAAEDAEWDKGAKKGNAKKEAAEAKAAEAARKKAEREALLAEEEKSLPSRAGPKNAKTAVKKTKGLDLSSLDEELPALNASGIDNGLEAFDVINKTTLKIDRHAERRTAPKAAFFQKREEELKAEAVLKLAQRRQQIEKEWKKHPDNPENQVTAPYNATKEELREISAAEQAKIEQRLAAK